MKSWSEVTVNSIKNCWYHTGLIKKPIDFNFNEDKNEITVLRQDISKLNFTHPMDISEYLNFTEEKIIEQIIDESESTEIIEGNSNWKDDWRGRDEEVDDTETGPKITNSRALEYVTGLIHFLEQQSDDCTKQILNLNALKCKLSRKMECEMKQTSILDYFSNNNNK